MMPKTVESYPLTAQASPAISRPYSKISRPYSKLTRLCQQAASRGGKLTTFAAVAEALNLSRGRITQLFGYGQESEASLIPGRIIGAIAGAFQSDGVPCEIDWLYLNFEDFVERLAAPSAGSDRNRTHRPVTTPTAEWERRQTTLLPDLVELSLAPPRPGNEIPDSYYVYAELRFGTADYDYEPEDGSDPRTISITLTKARLIMGSETYRPLPDTTVADRVQSPYFRRVAGGIEIIGPAPAGTLDGKPFGDEYLALIAGTYADDEPFPVMIVAARRGFSVADPDAPPNEHEDKTMSANRNAVLNVLLNKHLKRDEANRPILAKATMKRLARKDGG